MSADEAQTAGEPGRGQAASATSAGEPTEEELRAAYEAELSRLTTTDMIAQAVVSLLNIGARRLAPMAEERDPARPAAPAERDLEQARDAIDAVRALLDILERRIPQELRPLRDALSRLQMVYAQELGQAASPGQAAAATGEQPAGAAEGAPAAPSQEPDPARPDDQSQGPGPAEASGRLWVPGR